MFSFSKMSGMILQGRNSYDLYPALLFSQLKGDTFAWNSEVESTKAIDGIINVNRDRRRLARTKRWI